MGQPDLDRCRMSRGYILGMFFEYFREAFWRLCLGFLHKTLPNG